MTWDEALDSWTIELRAGGTAEGSIRLWSYYVKRAARELLLDAPAEATLDLLLVFMAAHQWRPETRKSARTALTRFFGWAARRGVVDVDPAAQLPTVTVPLAEPRPADDEDIREALAVAGDRVRLMILLGALAGMRRAEIARVHTSDLRGLRLTVRGKGGRDRTITLPVQLARLIEACEAGYVFAGPDGHLGAGYVGRLISRALPAGTTPHPLRHAAASGRHDAGVTPFELRVFLGHTNVSTTQRYIFIRGARTTLALQSRALELLAS